MLERRYPGQANNSREVAEGLLAIDADRMRERGWEVDSVTWIENRWVRRVDFLFSILPYRIFPRGGSWGHLRVAFRRSMREGRAEGLEAGRPEP